MTADSAFRTALGKWGFILYTGAYSQPWRESSISLVESAPAINANGALARCYPGFFVPAAQQMELVRCVVEVHAGVYAMCVFRIAEDRNNDSGDWAAAMIAMAQDPVGA